MRLFKIIGLSLALLLSACSSINSKLSASNTINPDIDGTPSPVAVSVFTLSDVKAFQAADFYSLYSNERQALGSSLLNEQDLVLSPGETTELALPYSEAVHYVAFVAAFRNFDHVIWRAVVPINAKPQLGQSLMVLVDARGIHVNAAQGV